jgi:hypothetical protein
VIFFLTLPLSGLFAWNYYMLYRRITGGFRIRKYKADKVAEFDLLQKEHQELINIVSGL